MTEIEVRNDHISVIGHAGYAESGHDIVCAAVSALTQGLILSLEALTDDEVHIGTSDGEIHIGYEHLSEAGRTLVDAFFVAVSAVAGSYGDYITIK